MKKMNSWVMDYETVNNERDCRVWAYGVTQIGSEIIYYGTSIEDSLNFMFSNPGIYYFHNLKFDGTFIVYYLLKNGYIHTKEKKVKENEFNTLISDMGQWYQIRIGTKDKAIEIRDSLKILPLSVKDIAKAFGLEEGKGEIDYNKKRPVGYQITEEEKDYIRRDVQIVAHAILKLQKEGMTKLTQAGNAFSEYKKMIGKKSFKTYFPVLECDSDIRKAYRGGYTYANEKFQGLDIGRGIVLDVNSLYPYVLYSCDLPYGYPHMFSGKYKKDKKFPLYIQFFTVTCELKDGYLPIIQLKNNMRFRPNEYIKQIDEPEEIAMTNIDMELLFTHYYVKVHKWNGGWKFKMSNKLFKSYVNKWTKIKKEATLNKNYGLRTIAKLMQNSLYGRFGINPKVRSKYPVLEDGEVRYKIGEVEYREPVYIPVAVFTTSWARSITIRAAQKMKERFLYADTDSLHLIGIELPKDIPIHNVNLGAWKLEMIFEQARYLRSKTYLELEYVNDEEMIIRIGKGEKAAMFIESGRGWLYKKIICAGMPERCYPEVTWDNFHEGTVYQGKLQHKVVQGGTILFESTFQIK